MVFTVDYTTLCVCLFHILRLATFVNGMRMNIATISSWTVNDQNGGCGTKLLMLLSKVWYKSRPICKEWLMVRIQNIHRKYLTCAKVPL